MALSGCTAQAPKTSHLQRNNKRPRDLAADASLRDCDRVSATTTTMMLSVVTSLVTSSTRCVADAIYSSAISRKTSKTMQKKPTRVTWMSVNHEEAVQQAVKCVCVCSQNEKNGGLESRMRISGAANGG